MKAAEYKRSIIVGIFIFLGLAILIAGVLILGGKQKRFVKSITLKAVFDDVSGLTAGNNIWFSGVKIGTVKKISFYGNSQVMITMHIEEEAQKYIRKDSKAKLSTDGLIGNKIIEIYGGNPRHPTVEDGDRLQVKKALSTEEMMETLQENNKNLLGITGDFKLLSLKINRGQGTVGALLTDSLLAENFRTIVSNLQQASANTSKVAASVSQFTAKLNNKGTLANELLTDTTVFRNLKESVAQLQKTTSSAAQITDNLKSFSNKLNSNNNALGILLNDENVAAKLKTTLGNLETSSQKLDENLEALQHNFLLRGFFKKKAQEDEKNKNKEKVQEQQ